MNKPALVAAILAHLDRELDRYLQGASDARAAATDGERRAENKYDTRGLEASYLAHGQSIQARETAAAREQFAALAAREFAPGEGVALGALVELADGGERLWCFLGPAAGGTEILHEGQEVLVITPGSPLGRALLGRTPGERVRAGSGPGAEYRVASVR